MTYQGFPTVGVPETDAPVNRRSPTDITNPPSSLQDDAKNTQLLKALHQSTPIGAFAWPTRFSLQVPFSKSWENHQPWKRIRLPAEDVSDDYESYLLNADPIWQADQSRVDAILDILVLIDGNHSHNNPQVRVSKSGLTAKELFDELSL
ncbi:hypothetical protein C8034_v001333 [Colletotrichum sidae]|uniref:Uncharacterized protein n=1 Tax=Colletotrichum sidae TaxID=1347389 RepID=A0A4R8TET4_9PEZI|nr:hypothetical protein C8034_v001333 [Colletotrichum sidae]